MSKIVYIKLTKVSPTAGPFNIYDQYNHIIAEDVSRQSLIDGIGYTLDDDVTLIKLVATGECAYEKIVAIEAMTPTEFFTTETEIVTTGCVFRHLKNPTIYNYFYGNIEPYVIEYPFSYSPQDEIVQSIKSYDKVYQYTDDGTGVSSYANKIAVDDVYFNKLVVYNDQQSSGVLELEPKPLHNLKAYMKYPKYNSDSKTVLYTKSDNFYQVNTIYDVVRSKAEQLFITTCESLSVDKIVNQENMIYTQRSFNKPQLRAKDSRVRLSLTNRSDTHIVSNFIINSSMLSYK